MKRLFSFKTISLLITVALVIFFLYKCPFFYVIGVPCPGCGMTRAFIALLRLDFAEAFLCHPLFPVVIIAFIFFLLDRFKLFVLPAKHKDTIIIAVCLLFIVVYIIRLAGDSPIVYTDFKNSLIGRFFNLFKK